MLRVWIISLIFSICVVTGSSKPTRKGFDLGNATIPIKDIKDGGPRKDGIPAIDNPSFLSIAEVDYLKAEDQVMSVTHDGISRAYPIRILDHHEIVNDKIGDLAFAVTYCPLCGSGMVFNRKIKGEETTFGVSGLLYQSDVLLYDRATESLWSQLATKSVAGPRVDELLDWIPCEFMTWSSWKSRYEDGEVLSNKNGHRRNYDNTLYRGYETSDRVYFPVPLYREELGIKTKVIGIVIDEQASAYDLALLISGRQYTDNIGDRKLQVSYDHESQRAVITDSDSGEAIPHVIAYWFAWQGFHPDTRLISINPKE